MKKLLILFILLFIGFNQIEAQSVICIHGFLSSPRSFKQIVRDFRCELDIYLFDFPSRQRTIECHAKNLVLFMKEVVCEHPGEPIYFITHSTGALVLRAALNEPDCPPEAKQGKAVLIAPPNQGAMLARKWRTFYPVRFILGDYSGKELMCYDGCEIRKHFGDFPASIDTLIIAGCKGSEFLFGPRIANDGFVAVSETCLEVPHRKCLFPTTHAKLLTYRRVITLMKNFLLCPCAEKQTANL